MLLLAGALTTLLWTDRRGVEALEIDRLQVQARVVDDNLMRQLRGMDAALLGVRDEVEALRPDIPPARLADRLKLLSAAMPGVRTLLVLDARGRVVAASRDELLNRDLQAMPFFEPPRRSVDAGLLYISPPFRSVVGGLVVNVSRVVRQADGGFGGVVTATLDPGYFDVVLSSVLYAPDMRATLVHADGRVFMNMPPDPATLDLDLSQPGSLFSRHRDAQSAASVLTGRIFSSGDVRVVAARTVARDDLRMDRPIVAFVSRDRAALYRPWARRAIENAVFFAIVAVASGFALHRVQRRRRAYDDVVATAAQDRAQSARQLRLITDNVPALISWLDRDQRFRFANQAYRDWLGVDPASLIGKSLREVHGDTVYEQFRHHIEAGLAGQRVVYEREVQTAHGLRYVMVTAVPQRDDDGTVQGLYVLNQDLTARRAAELRSARSEERLSLALEGSGQALFDWDIRADRLYESAQTPTLRGAPAVERVISGDRLQAEVHPDDRATLRAAMEAIVAGEASLHDVEYRMRRVDGQWIWLRSRGRVVERDAEGRALRLAGTVADVHQRKLDEERLRQLAELDTLTGLPNRALFTDRLQQALLRAGRAGRPMALLFVDVDRFKEVNDTYGHQAGDQLLKVFADRLQHAVRKSDTVARLGGDEFTVVVEQLGHVDDARLLAAKLVEAAREPVPLDGAAVQISVSIGVAVWQPGEGDGPALLRRADAALYEAKRRGRDGFSVDGE